MNESVVLLVRDSLLRNACTQQLQLAGHSVCARYQAEGWSQLLKPNQSSFLIVSSDLRDADLDSVVRKARSQYPALKLVEIHKEEDSWIAKSNKGSEQFSSHSELASWLVQKVGEKRSFASDGPEAAYEVEIFDEEGQPDLILRGKNERMRKLLELSMTIAATDSTALIEGESGTGKDVIARLIHQRSRRSDQAWVALNCGAIPDSLLESELFGHEKGAFTGAEHKKEGLCVAAHGGTLFLDEIGEMPLEMQVKLLRFLQSGWLRPVGSNDSRKVDVRVIAATNRDLSKEVAAGRFRLDLFYRLNVINVRLPNLRERLDDVPFLVSAILDKLSSRELVPKRLSEETMAVLQSHTWPGNIRELENLVERICLLFPTGKIAVAEVQQQILNSSCISSSPSAWEQVNSVEEIAQLGAVPSSALSGPSGEALHESYPIDWTLSQVEDMHIRKVLKEHGGNKTQAAKTLGINVKTLYNKMKAAGMKREEFVE